MLEVVVPVISVPQDYTEEQLYVDLRPIVGHQLFLKCEGFNLAGSVALKTASRMIEAAERDGGLNSDSILVEACSGNLGVALAVIAANKGYRFVCVTGTRCSLRSRQTMEALGSEVHTVVEPTDFGAPPTARLDHVRALCHEDGRYLWLRRYADPNDPAMHETMTAPAIAEAFPELDVLFVGGGTVGALTGCARFFRQWHRPVRVVAVHSVDSRAPLDEASDHSHADDLVQVEEMDAILASRVLARSGFMFGGSTGAVVSGAVAWLEEHDSPGLTAVAIAPDLGEQYLGYAGLAEETTTDQAADRAVRIATGVEGRSGAPLDARREYWGGVLAGDGSAKLPRLSAAPTPGIGTHEATIPADLVAAARRLAGELEVPVSSVLLTAHAAVLRSLCAEREVVTGYLASPGAEPLPCWLTSEPDSWRDMLLAAARSESELLAHRDFPFAALRSELGLTERAFETLFDAGAVDAGDTSGDTGEHPAGAASPTAGPAETELTEGAVLRVSVATRDDQAVLRLTYRTEVLDAESAARVSGYHLTALGLIVADPDAEHRRQSLLSAEELRFQLEGLAGPERELPDQRLHELFEQRVATHPDAVAAVHGNRQLTYGELNTRANRLARAMLARGLRSEDVVAVVTERNLDWMTAVLAIFKAGGVYLPIEPSFPADRMATTLSRANCQLVLIEDPSNTNLDAALGALRRVSRLLIEVADTDEYPGDDLGTEVSADQLAYIYFTSGSTGEPKGAMCEHAGMLNHLYAKIEDLGIDEGQVVAQTAPQCFDISLWQLLAALLVGGRTLVIEQHTVLDVARFVDKIVEGRVGILQVVPSYLEAVLAQLERHPRELPDLKCLSVTGEALKKELAQRWFTAQPAIRLANAYGLTETSDDTNHEVMDRVPDTARIPLGRPVRNVRVYVVDDHLAPVPFGAPGLIAYSGVCVGRGYVNDWERTRAAYLEDPYLPGQRLLVGGDFGRWLPDGKLEFLGRRDSQVKISGFRIEIGEVENTLLKVPGVRDGAVVVAERGDQSKYLVAFYSGDRPIEVESLRFWLDESLPEYMVPTIFHWRETLPLTANGTIDVRALATLAAELSAAPTTAPDGTERGHQAPSTPTEQRMAEAWATALGLEAEQIGRLDDFFDRGGNSLSAVKLAVVLDRAVSLRDINLQPVLADLAALIDSRSAAGSEAPTEQ
jgi:amino acid adenylation domain-containing protein